MVVSNTYCVVFFFCFFPSSVDLFGWIVHLLIALSVFSNVYLSVFSNVLSDKAYIQAIGFVLKYKTQTLGFVVFWTLQLLATYILNKRQGIPINLINVREYHPTFFKNTMHNYIYILIHIVRTNTNEDPCFINVICVCLLMVVSNTYCVVFFFCFSPSSVDLFGWIVHLLIALSVFVNIVHCLNAL
jgi:hypothetical protein